MLTNDERYMLLDRIDRLEKALKNTILSYECELNDLNHEIELLYYYHELDQRQKQNQLTEISANELEFYAD